MTNAEFDAFVPASVAELERKQEQLETRYGIGRHARWEYDVDTGMLTFYDRAGTVAARAETTRIGALDERTLTWRWAWADDSVPQGEQEKSARIKALSDLTGRPVFSVESLQVDEKMPWEFTAMAVRILEGKGCYHVPVEDLHVFFAIDRLEVAS